jgi:hypothetical protein
VLGVNSSSQGEGSIAVGFNSTANGFNAQAFGTGASANGRNVIAIGTGATAQGFNTNSIAFGTDAFADGTNVTAFGAGARATGVNATAIGAGATSTRDNQIVLGSSTQEITAPNLAGPGNQIIFANSDGTLVRSGTVSMEQVDQAVNTTIPKLESAARNLGKAVESAGAIAAAMSAIPEVSLQEDEPVRCGIGTGGYGSQYAISAGCAVRVADRLHLNGAIAYTSSIDYNYGSTPSVAGRLGFSFPLGKINKSSKNQASTDSQKDISQVKQNIGKLEQNLQERDQQIEQLKARLDQLLQQANEPANASSREATSELITLLRGRIEELEKEKLYAQKENANRDKKIAQQDQQIQDLKDRLSEQENMFQRAMNQLKTLMGSTPAPKFASTSQAPSSQQR